MTEEILQKKANGLGLQPPARHQDLAKQHAVLGLIHEGNLDLSFADQPCSLQHLADGLLGIDVLGLSRDHGYLP
jgi:hypothetical protein